MDSRLQIHQGENKQSHGLRIPRWWQLRLKIGSILLPFFIIADPFATETPDKTDEITRAQAQGIHETARIYSVLASGWRNLGEDTGWSMATTILKESRRYSLDPVLVLAVIHVESSFSPTAVSKLGARGLMQILPFVAESLAEEARVGDWEGDRSLADPILNVKLGIRYLGQLKERFKDLKLALTAYNLGPTVLDQRLQEGEEIPLDYAKKVFSIHNAYRKQQPRTPTALPVHWGKEAV